MGVEVLREVGVAERFCFSLTFSLGVDGNPLFWRFDENAFETLSMSGCLLDKSFMKALKRKIYLIKHDLKKINNIKTTKIEIKNLT